MADQKNEGLLKQTKLAVSAGVATLRRDGPVTFAVETARFLKRGGKFDTYTDSRIDNESRWELIAPYIEEDDKIALDIGCAEGYFTRKLAEQGLYAIGIDKRASVESAQTRTASNASLEYKRMTVTPDNIEELPPTDITLLLTVIHWWHRNFGAEQSESMFRTVASKTDLIVFEPPGESVETDTVSEADDPTPERYWTEYVDNVLEGSADIKYLGMTDYMDKDRRDPLFIIDTSTYQK